MSLSIVRGDISRFSYGIQYDLVEYIIEGVHNGIDPNGRVYKCDYGLYRYASVGELLTGHRITIRCLLELGWDPTLPGVNGNSFLHGLMNRDYNRYWPMPEHPERLAETILEELARLTKNAV